MLGKIIDRLADAMGAENVENLTDLVVRVKGRAIERKSRQTVEIEFNEKGFVRHLNGSDNIRGVTPGSYNPE